MNELRKFLIFLRRQKATNEKFSIHALIWLFVSVVVAFIVDKFAGREWYFQTLRAFLAISVSLPLFSLGYLYTQRKITDKTLREQLSYKQRVNLSIVLTFFIALVYSMFVKPTGLMYTSISGVVLSMILGILTFVRPTSNEYVLYAYEIEDERDMTTERLNQEKIEQRNKLIQEKKNKKNKKDKKEK